MKTAYLVLLAALVFIGGCAVMDYSTLDTALPMAPKKFSVAFHQGLGFDVSTLDGENEMEEFYDDAFTWPVSGISLAFALDEKTDLMFRTSGAPSVIEEGMFDITKQSCQTHKLAIKRLAWQDKDRYLAVIPAATLVYGNFERISENKPRFYREYFIPGLETQLLYTKNFSKFIQTTAGIRANYLLLLKDINGEEQAPMPAGSAGARANVRLSLGPFFIIQELGFEVIPIYGKSTIVRPTAAGNIGIVF